MCMIGTHYQCYDIVQHLESLLCTRLWSSTCRISYCCTVVVQFRTILSSAYDVTITLCCVVWIARSYRALKLFCEWNTHYALVARWLYLATRKKKDEIWLIQGTRFLSIVFNLINIRGVVQHKWLMVWFVQWYEILQRGEAELNRTSIFHLMRNLVPLHDQPLAICILL